MLLATESPSGAGWSRLEQAKAQANHDYGTTLREWIPVPNGVDPIAFARQLATGADHRT
jgi:hypothetical protein